MSATPRIRVLVIDDSAYSRRTIVQMLEKSPLIEVVDWARDGEEALRKALDSPVDLITLDLEMPRMDGFTFLRILMAKRPTPVVVISGRAGDQDVFKALDLGAVDFLAKPSQNAAPDLAKIEEELLRKVLSIRELRIEKVAGRHGPVASERDLAPVGAGASVVAIGASTGGPAALMQVFGSFETPPPVAFLVAQHMPGEFTRGFSERLHRLTCFEAREARPGDEPRPGLVLVAPGGSHLELETVHRKVRTRLIPGARGDKYAPAVDRLFASAAKAYGERLLAMILTGMGDDGSQGARLVGEAGGTVIAESEETAVIFGMPRQAIDAGVVDRVLPLWDLAPAIQAAGGIADTARRGRE